MRRQYQLENITNGELIANENDTYDKINTSKTQAIKEEKQRVGGLACKHDLHHFDTAILDKAFSLLSLELSSKFPGKKK